MAIYATTRKGRALLRRSVALRGLGDDSSGFDLTSFLNTVVTQAGNVAKVAVSPGYSYVPNVGYVSTQTGQVIGSGTSISPAMMQYGIMAIAAVGLVAVMRR